MSIYNSKRFFLKVLMEDKISHFVVTRYNLSLYTDKSIRDKIGCDPDEWMARRIGLFTRFTVPSLKHQTCQDFKWLVFIDRNTPAPFIHQIEDVAPDNMHILPFRGGQAQMLKKEIQTAESIVITSRIDNDDAWHKDFVKLIQTGYAKPTKLVEPYQSYWLDLNTKKIYHHQWKWYYRLNRQVGNNPTMIEWKDNAKTVLVAQHTKLKEQVKWRQFKQITRGCYRLIVCHQNNVINSVSDGRMRLREVGIDVLRDFNISLD